MVIISIILLVSFLTRFVLNKTIWPLFLLYWLIQPCHISNGDVSTIYISWQQQQHRYCAHHCHHNVKKTLGPPSLIIYFISWIDTANPLIRWFFANDQSLFLCVFLSIFLRFHFMLWKKIQNNTHKNPQTKKYIRFKNKLTPARATERRSVLILGVRTCASRYRTSWPPCWGPLDNFLFWR